jgi:hypothetical protein
MKRLELDRHRARCRIAVENPINAAETGGG